MKLAMISDPHILINKPIARLDDAVETSFSKMNFILSWCKGNNANLIIAGDLTDKPRSWHLLPRILDMFSNYQDVKVFAVFGQHDTYMYSEETRDKTILGALYSAGLVEILGEKASSWSNLFGCSYGQKIPEVEYKNEKNILVIHAPIAEAPLFPNHKYMDAKKFLKDNKDFDIILCGDIHKEFFIFDKQNRTILNTGPMIRKTADDYNFTFKPNFMVYDTVKDKFERVEIPHRPAEEVLSREHLDITEEKELLRSKFTESLSKEIELDMSFTGNLEIFLKEKQIRKGIRDILAEELSLIGG